MRRLKRIIWLMRSWPSTNFSSAKDGKKTTPVQRSKLRFCLDLNTYITNQTSEAREESRGSIYEQLKLAHQGENYAHKWILHFMISRSRASPFSRVFWMPDQFPSGESISNSKSAHHLAGKVGFISFFRSIGLLSSKGREAWRAN